MEVKPGYKLTDVGVIPEDWDAKPLAGLAVIIHGFGFQSRYFKPHGSYRLTTPGHFYETGGFRDVGDKQKFYDGPLPDGYLLSEGDLIVAMTEQADGLLGSAALVPTGGTYLHNQRLGKIKVLSSEISISFLYCVFNSRSYRAKVRETAAGTKVKHTSPSKLLEILIPFPPTEAEQNAIAAALSDVDSLIAALDRLIAKKRDIKQAAMQELLTGKRRLPGFADENQYKRTEVGLVPENWTVKSIGSILNKGKLGGNYSNQDKETHYPLIKMGNIGRGSIDLGKIEYISDGIIPNEMDRLRYGDLLFNTRNTLDLVGKVAIWRNELPIAYFNSNLMRLDLKPEEIASTFYANYAFNSTGCIARLKSIATGTTSVAAIYTRDLLKIPFPCPPLPEQQAIAAVLSDMDTEIAALEARREKTRALKQGMMQELLTGRIRLV